MSEGVEADRAALTADELWSLWRRIVAALPLWRMPIDSVFAPSAQTLFGVDYVSGLRRNRSTRKVFDLVAPIALNDLRRIHLLAQVNHRRHEAISRWMAIGLVTLPVSGALALAQLAPALLLQIRTEWLNLSVTSLGVIAAVVVFHLAAAWRARQVATVIELAFVERGVALDPSGAEADAEPPQLVES